MVVFTYHSAEDRCGGPGRVSGLFPLIEETVSAAYTPKLRKKDGFPEIEALVDGYASLTQGSGQC